MSSKKYIQDELNELNSQLPGEGQGKSYSVPQGYFENFAATVMAKIRENEGTDSASAEIAGLSPLLAGLSRTTPYSVPDGYFDQNLQSLSAFTNENEESLVLSFIEKEMPYEVPRGYFANFPDTVLEKLNGGDTKVVPIIRRRWMHIAAAAVVAGIITLSGLAYFKSGTTVKDTAAVEIKKASTEDLNTFIKSTDINLLDENTTAQNSNDVKQLLKDVSDKELEAFLDQVPAEDEEEFDIN